MCSKRWINISIHFDSQQWSNTITATRQGQRPPSPAAKTEAWRVFSVLPAPGPRCWSTVTWLCQDGVAQLLLPLGYRFSAGVLRCPGAGACWPAGAAAAGDLAWDGWVTEGRSKTVWWLFPYDSLGSRLQSASAEGEDRGHTAPGWPDVRIWGILYIGKEGGEETVFWWALTEGYALRWGFTCCPCLILIAVASGCRIWHLLRRAGQWPYDPGIHLFNRSHTEQRFVRHL